MKIHIENARFENCGGAGMHVEGYVDLTANNIVSTKNKGNGITIGSHNPRLKRLIASLTYNIATDRNFDRSRAAVEHVLKCLNLEADKLKSNKKTLIQGFNFINYLAVEASAQPVLDLLKQGWDYVDSMR